MQRSCDVCGRTYQAQRASSKYCSSGCRARKSKGEVVPLAPPPDAEPDRGEPPLVAATRRELDEAERTGTALGQATLALAAQASAPGQTGQAVAALVRELRATMAEALKGAAKSTAPQQLRDELAERRRRHGA